MKVINTKARVISAGSVRFIPATPVECDIKKLAKMYPAIQGMLDSGELKVITEAEAVVRIGNVGFLPEKVDVRENNIGDGVCKVTEQAFIIIIQENEILSAEN